MTRLPTRMALIALAFPLGGPAVAQSPSITPPPAAVPPTPPSRGDEEMGGNMTLAQFQARQESRIMAVDTDGDGRISLAEWTAAMSGRRRGSGGGGHGGGGYDPSRMFERMDANHDGFLDKGEINAAATERFQRMDSNGDGVVTPDERAAQRGGGRRHGGPEGVGAGAPPPASQP